MSWGAIVAGLLFAGLLVLAGQDLVQRIDEANDINEPIPTVAPATATGPTGATGPVPAGRGAERERLRPGSATTLQLSYASTGLWLQDRGRGPDANDALAMRTAEQHRSVAASQDGRTVFVKGCCPAGEPLVRLELREAEPPRVDVADWRGVSDVDLALPSGTLAFAPSSTADALAFVQVPKGRYRARVSTTVSATEFFEVVLWPSDQARPMKVHKEVEPG